MTALIRLLGAAIVGLFMIGTVQAQTPIGKTERVQGEAVAVRDSGTAALNVGDAVYMNDILETGDKARLTVTFIDGQSLTLGENAEIIIDEFVYEDDPIRDASVLRWVSGAFLTATGAIGKSNPESVLVNTPVATIGIRGTQFWGGRLEKDFEVLVLEGAVVVRNESGEVQLNPGQTTSVASATTAPTAATIMADDRRVRAFATVQYAE